ncbi:Hsp20/alpha crystallin family protein [Nesterenkonia sp. LB17]|uniref:Hsp20/alpha crystallin family protein n=1 Tax=unclassified Nesterenkonia TaxID=2629769 RepID=UPI001F4CD47B|nr:MULTISPECIES: Hsp20/alpha crystallin family protein [unclassified Nesterenkonia]MCH8559759.1 Hsp20/alpha crystallin family protein [Nesterenkonia sp. DZ6]MCH8561923.1 Hsp20/alpha crystallin family protein [Nesterenkonia sp. YGD6]MCH8564540.1 Hsp20/alpha crystallin family protein [Nesterenkonia sp. LB17]MCH8570166.1 Hsp20/alpha crystallin family protein [Nesterenkonia sp. AY15]
MNNSLTRLDPFALIDDVFRSMRTPSMDAAQRQAGFVPAVDAHREGEDLVLRADLPGIDPDKDVAVELTGRTLTVSGERRSETEAEGLREVRYGSFSRTITLPGEVSSDAISATYESGVLTVRVTGVYATEEPRKIQVTSTEREKNLES